MAHPVVPCNLRMERRTDAKYRLQRASPGFCFLGRASVFEGQPAGRRETRNWQPSTAVGKERKIRAAYRTGMFFFFAAPRAPRPASTYARAKTHATNLLRLFFYAFRVRTTR